MKKISVVTLLASVCFSASAYAEFKVLIGVDPADMQSKNLATLVSPTPGISSALGTQVSLRKTADLTDAMRATRTQENDVVVGPAHVAASATTISYWHARSKTLNLCWLHGLILLRRSK